MLGILLDLLAGVVALLSLLWFGWLGIAGLISPRLVGGRSRLGLLGCSVFGCVISLYLMDAMSASEPEPEPELATASVAAPVPPPDPPPPPPPLPDTTWIVESGVVAAVGERERLRLGAACRYGAWIIALDVVDDSDGGPTAAHWFWDGEPSINYTLVGQNAAGRRPLTTLRNWDTGAEIVDLLRTRTVLGLRVETIHAGYERGEVWDTFGLAGSADAFNSLACERAVPTPAPAPQPRERPSASYDLDTEAGIVATLAQSSIGSSLEVVLSLMAGYDPTASRVGEDRRFTYRFDDGSGLVLVFRPPGGPGTGLVLEDIIVR